MFLSSPFFLLFFSKPFAPLSLFFSVCLVCVRVVETSGINEIKLEKTNKKLWQFVFISGGRNSPPSLTSLTQDGVDCPSDRTVDSFDAFHSFHSLINRRRRRVHTTHSQGPHSSSRDELSPPVAATFMLTDFHTANRLLNLTGPVRFGPVAYAFPTE